MFKNVGDFGGGVYFFKNEGNFEQLLPALKNIHR
jgi:hypothetical protein